MISRVPYRPSKGHYLLEGSRDAVDKLISYVATSDAKVTFTSVGIILEDVTHPIPMGNLHLVESNYDDPEPRFIVIFDHAEESSVVLTDDLDYVEQVAKDFT